MLCKKDCFRERSKLRAHFLTMQDGKIQEFRMGLKALVERSERSQRMRMLELEALVVRRCALKEEIEGGDSFDYRTLDQMAESWDLMYPMANQTKDPQHTKIEYTIILLVLVIERVQIAGRPV